MDALLRRRLMMAQGGGELPVGAIKFDYLRSFGDCAIDTGVGDGASTADLEVSGKYWFRPTAASKWLYAAELANGYYLGLESLNAKRTRLQSGDGGDHPVSSVSVGSDKTMTISGGKVRTDYTELTMPATTLASDIQFFDKGDLAHYGAGDMEEQIISIGGAQVADLVPCTDPLGVPAMYDKVSGTYKYNIGTGILRYGHYCKAVERGSFGNSSLQGMAIYGDIAVRMGTSTTHRVYQLTDSAISQITTFTLSGTGHSNALQFAPTLESGQTLPYLYVSDITDSCYVLSFDSSYQATIVQTITVSGETAQVLADDQGYIWISRGGSGNHRYFAKYRKVLVSEGASVTLTAADKLEEWETYDAFPSSQYTAQGWKIKGGKIYFLYGASTADSIKGVNVYDTTSHRCLDVLDFTKTVFVEPEDIDFYNGQMVLANVSGTAYNISKIQRGEFDVPAGYTPVEYLQMDGAGSFTLDMVASEATDAMELDLALTTVTAQMRLESASGNNPNFNMYVNGSLGLGFRHGGNWKGMSGTLFDTSRHIVVVDYRNASTWFDNASETFTGSASNTSSVSIGVGLQYSAQPRLKGKVYGGRNWRCDALVRDLVMLRDDENTPYVWDKANGVFRAVSGTVTVGPDL